MTFQVYVEKFISLALFWGAFLSPGHFPMLLWKFKLLEGPLWWLTGVADGGDKSFGSPSKLSQDWLVETISGYWLSGYLNNQARFSELLSTAQCFVAHSHSPSFLMSPVIAPTGVCSGLLQPRQFHQISLLWTLLEVLHGWTTPKQVPVWITYPGAQLLRDIGSNIYSGAPQGSELDLFKAHLRGC